MSTCGRSGATGAAVLGLPIAPQPAIHRLTRAHVATRLPLCSMSFFARRGGGGRAQRQAHAEMRAATLCFEDLDAAAMGIDELRHHRQADAGALDVPALRRFALVEGFENS